MHFSFSGDGRQRFHHVSDPNSRAAIILKYPKISQVLNRLAELLFGSLFLSDGFTLQQNIYIWAVYVMKGKARFMQ